MMHRHRIVCQRKRADEIAPRSTVDLCGGTHTCHGRLNPTCSTARVLPRQMYGIARVPKKCHWCRQPKMPYIASFWCREEKQTVEENLPGYLCFLLHSTGHSLSDIWAAYDTTQTILLGACQGCVFPCASTGALSPPPSSSLSLTSIESLTLLSGKGTQFFTKLILAPQ